MKFTKMARISCALTLFTASVMNIYLQYRASLSYNKLRVSINDLKGRIAELRSVANSITRQINTNNIVPALTEGTCVCKEDNLKSNDVKYTVINRNGVLGIFNAEDQLVGRRKLVRLAEADAKKLENGIDVNGDCELDSLLLTLGCEEEI